MVKWMTLGSQQEIPTSKSAATSVVSLGKAICQISSMCLFPEAYDHAQFRLCYTSMPLKGLHVVHTAK